MTTVSKLLARRFKVDVSTNGFTWTALAGLNSINPAVAPRILRTVVYGGRARNRVRGQDWSLTVGYNQLATGTARNAGQALVETRVNQLGDDATLYVRWYDRNGIAEAWSGLAVVELHRTAAGVPDLSQVQVVFTGDGALSAIANPG